MCRIIVVLFSATVLQQLCTRVPGAEGGATVTSTLPGDKVQDSTGRASTLAVELYFRPGSCRLSRNNQANLRRAVKTCRNWSPVLKEPRS